jgi:hypothetical protein
VWRTGGGGFGSLPDSVAAEGPAKEKIKGGEVIAWLTTGGSVHRYKMMQESA